jgi:predicted double-glycine peptidase
MIIPIRVRGYNHFVVVRKVTSDQVDIADPGFGGYRVPRARFAKVWRGIGYEVKKPERVTARRE